MSTLRAVAALLVMAPACDKSPSTDAGPTAPAKKAAITNHARVMVGKP